LLSAFKTNEDLSYMNITNVVDELKQERDRLQGELQRIDAALAALVSLNGRGRTKTGRPRRTMSAAARRKIAAAQRARWAKVRAAAKS
jgi:nucleoid-associated protein YgaU